MTKCSDGSWLLLLEHAANGDIISYYERKGVKGSGKYKAKGLSMIERVELANQLLKALRHMHGLHIFHRDLKPQNIMISAEGTVMLGDFGATTDEERLDNQTGLFSPYYTDKNARYNKFSAACDIYSFGLCAYFIIHAKHLYHKGNKQAWLDNTEKNEEGESYEYMQCAINQCILDDTEQRPSFSVLQGEIEYALILEYCLEGTDEADAKAVALIQQTEFVLNY